MKYRIRNARDNENDRKELESEHSFHSLILKAFVHNKSMHEKPGEFLKKMKDIGSLKSLNSIITKYLRIK